MFNRRSRSGFLIKLEQLMTLIENARLSRTVRYYEIIFVGLNLINLMFAVLLKYKTFFIDKSPITYDQCLDIWTLVCSYTIDQCMVLMLFEYLLILKMMAEIKLALIRSAPNPHNLLKWRQICTLSNRFEDLFSLTPFMNITQNFMSVMMYIVAVYIRKVRMNKWVQIDIFYFLIQLITDVYALYVIDKLNLKLRRAVDKLLEKSAICTSGQVIQYATEISCSYRFNLTGYGLFNLEKSLIIGLGASLVSFTVLFIQISSM